MSDPTGFDLNDARIFVHVLDAGGISAAAKLAGMPKSTVSRRLAALEGQLGGRLIERSTRKLTVTDAGIAFYERVKNAIALMDEAASAVTEAQTQPHGRLRVTAPVDLAGTQMAEALVSFRRKFPAITLDLVATGQL